MSGLILHIGQAFALKPRIDGTPPEKYYKSWDPTHLNEDGNAL
jgi:hypothetical protein